MACGENNGLVAVLTGDLVRSTALSHDDLIRVRTVLASATHDIATWERGAIHGPDFFRGDSWQVVLSESRSAFRAAVYIRAVLRSLEQRSDTRIAIGLGAVEALDKTEVSRSVGEAFTLSGRALDGMNRFEGFKLALPQLSASQTYLPTVVALCDHIVGSWSPSQAKVALQVLRPDDRTQEDVGNALEVSRQFVNKVFRQSGLSAVVLAIQAFEDQS